MQQRIDIILEIVHGEGELAHPRLDHVTTLPFRVAPFAVLRLRAHRRNNKQMRCRLRIARNLNYWDHMLDRSKNGGDMHGSPLTTCSARAKPPGE